MSRTVADSAAYSARSLFACALWLASPATVLAQEQGLSLEEVVVTAQKREQNLQDVGISVLALSADKLTRAGIDDLKSLVIATPGVLINEFGGAPTINSVSIRGVTQLDFADHEESPNAVYVDGAYVSFMGGLGASMFDTERVEVLYGPQGTLFGRNATGGLVHVISKRPTPDFEASVSLTAGDYGLFKSTGVISGPLSQRVQGRLSVATDYNHGFAQTLTGVGRLFGNDSYSARGQLLFAVSDRTEILLNVHGNKVDNNGVGSYFTQRAAPNPDNDYLVEIPADEALYAANCVAIGYGVPPPGSDTCLGYRNSGDPFKLTPTFAGTFYRKYNGMTATLNMDFGDTKLTAISDYQDIRKRYYEDSDGTPDDVLGFRTDQDAQQFSQELRLSGENGPVRWLVGGYFLRITGDYGAELALPIYSGFIAGADFDHSTTSYAAFSQVEYDFAPSWTVIAGARWTHDRKRMDLTTQCNFGSDCPLFGALPPGEELTGRRTDEDWSGKLTLQWQVSDDVMFYGGVTRGTKGGLIQAPVIVAPGTTFANLLIEPEVLTNTEIGMKATILDGKGRLNLSAYHYDYKDYQAFSFAGIAQTLFNADARIRGAQLDLALRPTRNLDLSLGVAYTDGIVKDVTLPSGRSADQRMPMAPRLSLSGSGRYAWPLASGSLYTQLDATYIGARYLNSVNHPAEHDESYLLANIRAGYASDRGWGIELFVDNVTDELYKIYATNIASIDGGVGSSYGAPRWFGVRASYDWK